MLDREKVRLRWAKYEHEVNQLRVDRVGLLELMGWCSFPMGNGWFHIDRQDNAERTAKERGEPPPALVTFTADEAFTIAKADLHEGRWPKKVMRGEYAVRSPYR